MRDLHATTQTDVPFAALSSTPLPCPTKEGHMSCIIGSKPATKIPESEIRNKLWLLADELLRIAEDGEDLAAEDVREIVTELGQIAEVLTVA
jgi:hypothetical protein